MCSMAPNTTKDRFYNTLIASFKSQITKNKIVTNAFRVRRWDATACVTHSLTEDLNHEKLDSVPPVLCLSLFLFISDDQRPLMEIALQAIY